MKGEGKTVNRKKLKEVILIKLSLWLEGACTPRLLYLTQLFSVLHNSAPWTATVQSKVVKHRNRSHFS